MTNDLLIVVDMQNDFITGSLGTVEAQAVLPKIEQKLKNFNGFVVFTKDTHDEHYLKTQEGRNLPVVHCVKGTAGWGIPESLLAACFHNDVRIIHKDSFGFHDWRQVLENLRVAPIELSSIQFVGVCTDICVVSNALIMKSLYPEVPLSVDSACCAGVTPEKHEAALEVLRSCQIAIL